MRFLNIHTKVGIICLKLWPTELHASCSARSTLTIDCVDKNSFLLQLCNEVFCHEKMGLLQPYFLLYAPENREKSHEDIFVSFVQQTTLIVMKTLLCVWTYYSSRVIQLALDLLRLKLRPASLCIQSERNVYEIRYWCCNCVCNTIIFIFLQIICLKQFTVIALYFTCIFYPSECGQSCNKSFWLAVRFVTVTYTHTHLTIIQRHMHIHTVYMHNNACNAQSFTPCLPLMNYRAETWRPRCISITPSGKKTSLDTQRHQISISIFCPIKKGRNDWKHTRVRDM